MKRLTTLILLLILTVLAAVSPDGRRIVADHSAQQVEMVVPPVRTFDPQANNVYRLHTPSELGARSTTNYRVPYVLPKWWVNERPAVVEHDARRWHRAQTWRRSF